MRVLGIDIGLKRTGLALSDETGIAIRHLPNLVVKNRAEAVERILSLVKEFSIQVIVIGYPEQRTPASKAVASRGRGLKDVLEKFFALESLKIEIHLWNEARTSKDALTRLIASGQRQKKRKHLLDAASAALLIEEFLFWHARAIEEGSAR
jgi:putative Holliday junction resolvase